MGVCFSLGILNVKQLSLLFIVLPLLCSLYHRTLPNFRFKMHVAWIFALVMGSVPLGAVQRAQCTIMYMWGTVCAMQWMGRNIVLQLIAIFISCCIKGRLEAENETV